MNIGPMRNVIKKVSFPSTTPHNISVALICYEETPNFTQFVCDPKPTNFPELLLGASRYIEARTGDFLGWKICRFYQML
jgi:hypothetical protein